MKKYIIGLFFLTCSLINAKPIQIKTTRGEIIRTVNVGPRTRVQDVTRLVKQAYYGDHEPHTQVKRFTLFRNGQPVTKLNGEAENDVLVAIPELTERTEQ